MKFSQVTNYVCCCMCAYSALAIGHCFFGQLHLHPNTTTNITAYLPVLTLIAAAAAAAAVTVGTINDENEGL